MRGALNAGLQGVTKRSQVGLLGKVSNYKLSRLPQFSFGLILGILLKLPRFKLFSSALNTFYFWLQRWKSVAFYRAVRVAGIMPVHAGPTPKLACSTLLYFLICAILQESYQLGTVLQAVDSCTSTPPSSLAA